MFIEIERDISEIRDKTPYPEQLAMIAEECTELAQAALKMRRVVDRNASPTSTTKAEAVASMIEEISDVLTCLLVLGDYIEYLEPAQPVENVMKYKAVRWQNRIREANN